MATFGEVFQRVEKKYRLSARQRQALQPYLDKHMELDSYGKSTVTSLYLDTNQSDLICRSLEKPLYKEKLRVRCYGSLQSMDGASEVFLEIKKKFKGVVYKRRIRLTWAAAQSFLGGMSYEDACRSYPLADQNKAAESVSPRSLQIAREIEQFVQFHGPLQFSMSTACERMAFARRSALADIPLSTAGAGVSPFELDDSLRITFDDDIRYCQLAAGDLQEHALLGEGECVMEVKAVGAMPLWLVRAFSECGIKPTSFSKYGESFKASRTNKE